eukprot:3790865-Lingulodinium_polyedra.AAC.1
MVKPQGGPPFDLEQVAVKVRQDCEPVVLRDGPLREGRVARLAVARRGPARGWLWGTALLQRRAALSLIHISEPTRR